MLCLNADKTKYLIILSRQRMHDQTNQHLTIIEYEIGSSWREKSIQFLRIPIDEHLTWKYHIQQINNKTSGSLFISQQYKLYTFH